MKRALFSKFFACMFMIVSLFFVGDAYSAPLPSSGCLVFKDYLDANEDGKANCDDMGGGDPGFSATFGDDPSFTISGTGICSTTGNPNYFVGDTGTPSSTPGQYCWCQLTGFEDYSGATATGASTYSVLVRDDYNDNAECAADCGCSCAKALSQDEGLRGEFYNLSFCIGSGGGGGCGTTLLDLFPGFCDYVYDGGEPKGGMDWEAYLVGSDTLSVYGTSMCGTNSGTHGSAGNPGSSGGSDCWCRLTELDDGGSNHFIATSSDWFYYGDDWGNYADCAAYCPEMCAKKLFSEIPCDMAGGEFCTSGGSTPTYSVTYSCSPGSGSPTDSNSPYADGATVTTLPANSCTAPSDQVLLGWNCGGTYVPAGGTFTMPASNTTCSAVYSTFSVDTVSMASGSSIQFSLSAQGTFYVNCGTGGVLSGPNGSGVVGNTITKNDTTNYTYTCTYTGSTGTKRISFGGTATGYAATTPYNYTTISFYVGATDSAKATNAAKIASVYGSLSSIFPRLGSSDTQNPRFMGTFMYATNLTAIPATLFSGYTGNLSGAAYMFTSTFFHCTGLISIPSGLFSGITTGAYNMFAGTFGECTGLTGNNAIPANLFSSITSGDAYMFANTFGGCSGLTSIPSGLFSGIETGVEGMFEGTFSDCYSLTSIPSGLFYNITTGAPLLFAHTFEGCYGLTGANAIPSNLFSRITVGAVSMFFGTFEGCYGLTTLPSGLFASIANISNADSMFRSTFDGCSNISGYIPADFFAGIIPAPSSLPSSFMLNIFNGCTNLATTTCPTGTATYTTGYESYWDSHVSCSTAYTVSYGCGTGSGTPTDSNSPYLPNATVTTLTGSVCTAPTGYDFGAWNCGSSVNSGNNVSAGGTFSMPATNVTCTAQWTPKTTAITYDCGTGTMISGQSGNMSTTFTYGQPYSFAQASTLCQKVGYYVYPGSGNLGAHNAYGWICKYNNTTPVSTYGAESGQSWNHTWADLTCTAQWAARSYTVTYNCNGGSAVSGATMSASFQYDGSYSLAAVTDKCSRLGYDPATGGSHNVGGWVCTVESQADTYLSAASGTWTYANDYTCRAQWREHTTSVTFDCDNGNATTTATYYYGSNYNVANNAPSCSRPGYRRITSGTNVIANGWRCELGNGVLHTVSGTWTSMENTMTCTATWERDFVSYGCGAHGTAGISQSDLLTMGASYTFRTYANSGCTIENGYTFSNWSCSSLPGSTNTVNQTWNANYTVNPWNYDACLSCVAQYTANTYTLTYNVNAPYGSRPSGTTASTTATMGQSATVATNGFSVSGWNFASWRCTNTTAGIDVTFSSGQTVNPWIYPANLTCAAQWTQDTTQYTVSYNCGQSGSGTPPASQSFMLNQAYTLADSPGSCVGTVGYKFNGWSCTNGLSGALNSNGTPASGSWSLTSNSTCSPSWTSASANTIDLEWTAPSSGQPGWTSSNPASCSYGSTLSVLPNAPGKDGYHFTGWSVVKNWFRTHSNYGSNDYYAKVLSGGNTICKKGTYSSSWSLSTVNCSTYATVFNTLSLYEWAALETDFYWFGTSLCSMTPSVIGQNIGSPSSTAGRFCWCKLTKHAEVIGNAIGSLETEDDMPWVHMNCLTGVAASGPGFNTTADCQASCASRCAEAAATTASQAPWRSLYGGGTNSVTTDGTCVSGLGGL